MADQVLSKYDLPDILTVSSNPSENLLQQSNGLTNSKLSKSTANTGDVLEGKTFYSKDKTLKTGTLPNRGAEQTGGGFAWDNDYVYIQPIPEGYYHLDHPNNAAWNPRVRCEKYKFFDTIGGNRSGWGTTINPGSSVTIPQGYHDGTGTVTANSAQSQLKTGRVSCFFTGSDWVQTKTLDCAGTVVGITSIKGTGTHYAGETISINNCPEGRGIKFYISGSQIIVKADNLVSTNTIYIDYVYI